MAGVTQMVTREHALPGRDKLAYLLPEKHFVLGTPLVPPWPDGFHAATFGLGCFWGAEQRFWESGTVFTTVVGYSGGFTPFPTYEEVCTGRTGHTEAVQVIFDPQKISFDALLKLFWESHDPTQGMRQGGDSGTQYRSAIYFSDSLQHSAAKKSRGLYEAALKHSRYGRITTEIAPLGKFYPAEDYHQQYLAKNPGGYCGLGGTGVTYP